jgi:hypothetical protein
MLRAYTVAQTARALDMSTTAVREAIARGLIWAFNLGKAIRVPADEVERVQATSLVASVKKSQVNATLPKAGADDRK